MYCLHVPSVMLDSAQRLAAQFTGGVDAMYRLVLGQTALILE